MTTLDEELPEIAGARPVWLMTLADLALLLVGFFVFIQASQHLDKATLARGIRAGFGVQAKAASTTVALEPMAVSVGEMRGFAPGSALLPYAGDSLVAWARDATRDRRVTLRIIGTVDGSAGDVDPVTGSGAVLASDRARAVAALLLAVHAVPADRFTLVTAARSNARAVTITTGFAGGRP
jgi:hypothetical protein